MEFTTEKIPMKSTLDLSSPTTLTDKSTMKEPTKMVNVMDLTNTTSKTDYSTMKKPTKMVNRFLPNLPLLITLTRNGKLFQKKPVKMEKW